MVFYRGGGKSVLLESFLILIFLLALYSSTFLKLFFFVFLCCQRCLPRNFMKYFSFER